jgi:hypothetical protein
VRWMQEQRRYAASTVSAQSRWSPASTALRHRRRTRAPQRSTFGRPNVPPQSPTLAEHLQFDAVLAAAHDSNNLLRLRPRLLGLLGLRISKRPPWTSPTAAKSTGIGCYGSSARATRSCLCPCPRP